MTRPISADGLLLLLAVAECGSINGAAELLHLSQPALTKRVRDFEIRLGERVFARGSKGVELTPLGAILMERAKAVRTELRQAQLNFDELKRNQRHVVRIAAAPVHPIAQFAQAIVECSEALPQFHVSVLTGTQEEMLPLLESGEVEMVFGRLSSPATHPRLRQDLLYHDEAGIYCQSRHMLVNDKAPTLAQLANQGWVLGPPGTMMRDRVDDLLMQEGHTSRIAIQADEVPLRKALVAESDCLSAFQVQHVHDLVQAGRLHRLSVPFPDHGQPIGAVRLTAHTPFSERLVRSLRSRYRAAGFRCPDVAGPTA